MLSLIGIGTLSSSFNSSNFSSYINWRNDSMANNKKPNTENVQFCLLVVSAFEQILPKNLQTWRNTTCTAGQWQLSFKILIWADKNATKSDSNSMMFATTNSRIKTSQLDNCVHRYCKESLQSKLPITVTGLLNIAKYHLNWGKSLHISELKKLLTVWNITQ